MIIRRLDEKDWELYRAIRLEALEMAPEAFGSDVEEARKLSPEAWASRLSGSGDSFVLGAFLDGRIAGLTGFLRESRAKTRHRGNIWGVYVSQAARGRGMGRRLLEQVIDGARALSGLEQITLTVVAENAPARELYLSLGFQVYGKEPRALKVADRYLDEELMVLFIRP